MKLDRAADAGLLVRRRPLMRIGQEFELPPGNIWRVTDVGRRTFLAVDVTGTLLTHDGDKSWLNGPPYAVVEYVFDETDFGALADAEGIEWRGAKAMKYRVRVERSIDGSWVPPMSVQGVVRTGGEDVWSVRVVFDEKQPRLGEALGWAEFLMPEAPEFLVGEFLDVFVGDKLFASFRITEKTT